MAWIDADYSDNAAQFARDTGTPEGKWYEFFRGKGILQTEIFIALASRYPEKTIYLLTGQPVKFLDTPQVLFDRQVLGGVTFPGMTPEQVKTLFSTVDRLEKNVNNILKELNLSPVADDKPEPEAEQPKQKP